MRRLQYVVITFEGWLYLGLLMVLLFSALVRQINLLVIMYGLLSGPLLVSWPLVRKTLRELHVRRRFPRLVEAGESLSVTLELQNRRRKRGSWAIVAQDRVQRVGGGPNLKPTVMFSYVGAGRTATREYRGVLAERGRYKLGAVMLSTRFPFGLLRSAFSWEKTDELFVTPRRGTLTQLWYERLARVNQACDRGVRKSNALEGDFFGLREWRNDDGRRLIHWRTSARRQSLVVRQLELPCRNELTLIVDLWLPEQPTLADHDRLELTLSFAATVIDDLASREGTQFRLVLQGLERHEFNGPLLVPLRDEALQRLAVAQGTSHAAAERLADLVADHSHSRCVFVSPRAAPIVDPAEHGLLCIDTSSDALDDYFTRPRTEAL